MSHTGTTRILSASAGLLALGQASGAGGGRAIICALADVPEAMRGTKGTTVAPDAGEINFN